MSLLFNIIIIIKITKEVRVLQLVSPHLFLPYPIFLTFLLFLLSSPFPLSFPPGSPLLLCHLSHCLWMQSCLCLSPIFPSVPSIKYQVFPKSLKGPTFEHAQWGSPR